jgi:hypothetical protein
MIQFRQVLNQLWVRDALQNDTFVETMDYAVKNANYLLDGGTHPDDSSDDKVVYRGERHPGRYFRLHDSGDFLNVDYLRAWKEVANRNPDIMFWAPSRIWATSWGGHAVNEINTPMPDGSPSNLVIRASAFMINEPAPRLLTPPKGMGSGWGAGTTVFEASHKLPGGPGFWDRPLYETPYQWDCQTYAVSKKIDGAAAEKSASCRNVPGVDGVTGCRACWRLGNSGATIDGVAFPPAEVNYTLHL